MKFNVDTASTCCGVLEVGCFGEEFADTTFETINKSPTGLLVGYFVVGNPECEEAFQEMSARWPILFRSEVRKSTSRYASDEAKQNGIFMAVFKDREAL